MRKVIGAVLIVELIIFIVPTMGELNLHLSNNAAVLPAVLSDLTNQERQDQNVSVLKDNPILDRAALLKAEDMAAKQYFSHVSPDGKTPWYWLDLVGYKYDYAGENLAIDFSDSKDVTNAWMNSPGHRANIVKAAYTEMGTGVASGMYQGHETIYTVQVYANPRVQIAEVAPLKTPIQTEVVKTETKVLSASVVPKPAAVVAEVMTSPRHSMNTVLLAIALLVLLVLAFTLFSRVRVKRFDLVTNGLALVAFLGCIYLSNNIISHKTVALAEGESASVFMARPSFLSQ